MEALFIGQSYIDVTFLTDEMPTGDEKAVARDYAISFGGNAVTAAFCCAKLGVAPDLLTSVADDWLGRMFVDMAAKYGISIHHRKVEESSLSFVMPKGGQRAIVRCRDDHYLHPFPPLNLRACRALHVDGHQADAAIHYAKACREAGILTSLDGGGLRSNTHELLEFIDVAVVAERLCEQMHMTARRDARLSARAWLRGRRRDARRARARLVRGGGEDRELPALNVPPELVIDTNGAGDIFHGAYVFSYLTNKDASWDDHFRFARAASAIRSSSSATRRACRRSAISRSTQARFGERRDETVRVGFRARARRYSRFTGSFIATSLRRSLLMSRPSEK